MLDDSVFEFDEQSYIRSNTATNKNGNEIYCEGGAGTFKHGSYLGNTSLTRANFIDGEDTVCADDCGLATNYGTIVDYCDVIETTEEPYNNTRYVYVDDDGNCTDAVDCDGSELRPFRTILEGLEDANDETVVIVRDGTYTGYGNIDLEISDSYRRVSAEFSERGGGNVIIDCEGEGFGIALIKGTFELTGVTIKRCVGEQRNLTGIPLGNSTFTSSNLEDAIGGALWIEQAYALITNCSFEGNEADLGGGVYTYSSTVVMYGTTIDANVANMYGGGLYVWNGYLELNDSSKVIDNEAADGGGLFVV